MLGISIFVLFGVIGKLSIHISDEGLIMFSADIIKWGRPAVSYS